MKAIPFVYCKGNSTMKLKNGVKDKTVLVKERIVSVKDKKVVGECDNTKVKRAFEIISKS